MRPVEAFADTASSKVWGWGVLLSFKKSEKGFGGSAPGKDGKGDGDAYICDVLLPCAPRQGDLFIKKTSL